MKEYIKHGRTPYKKWPEYDVRPLSNVAFASYEEALKAEDILCCKTDLETTDVENIVQNVDADEPENKKRKKVLYLTEDRNQFNTSLDSDESSDKIPDPPNIDHQSSPLIQLQNTPEILTSTSVFRQNAFMVPNSEEIIENNQSNNIITPTEPDNHQEQLNVISNLDAGSLIITTNEELKLMKQEIIAEVKKHIDEKFQEMFDYVKNAIKKGTSSLDFEEEHGLPFETVQQIKEFDIKLANKDQLLHDFKHFLRQHAGKNLKDTVKVLSRLYSLSIQTKINFTGRENKFPLENLLQMKIIIDIFTECCKTSSPFVKDEIRYYLQHVSDRIRSQKNAEEKNLLRGSNLRN